jgi:dTDP-4-dehydrorhamnose reductase
LNAFGQHDHPVLDRPGWWHRPDRFYQPEPDVLAARSPSPRRLLLTGGSGTLAQAFARICRDRSLDYAMTRREDLDIADPLAVDRMLVRTRPWAIINCAGFVRVPDAETERERCFRENVGGATALARAAADRGIPLVTFSSDLVFDGRLGRAYRETDAVNPRSVYGESKAEAERRVGEIHPGALIVRTSAFFGPWDSANFPHMALNAFLSGRAFGAKANTTVSPTYVPDLVQAVLDLLIDRESGVWHLSNRGSTSWAGFARLVADGVGIRCDHLLREEAGEDTATVLESDHGPYLRALEDSIREFVEISRLRLQPGVLAAS